MIEVLLGIQGVFIFYLIPDGSDPFWYVCISGIFSFCYLEMRTVHVLEVHMVVRTSTQRRNSFPRTRNTNHRVMGSVHSCLLH
jgi:hypothetical protein